MAMEPNATRHRWTGRAWIRWPLLGLLTLSILLASGYLALQSRTGQEWAGSLAGRILSDANLGELRITRLALESWSRLRVQQIAVSDERGPWLEATEFVIDWRPSALLRGDVVVEAVTAPRVEVLRRPIDTPATSTAAGSLLPRPPKGLRSISIEQLRLHAPVMGVDARFAIRFRNAPGAGAAMDASLTVARLDRKSDRIEIVARTHPDDGRLTFRVQGHEAPDGVIARYLGLPLESPILIDLDGNGSSSDWKGTLRAGSGESTLAAAEIALNVHSLSDISFHAKGQVGAATLSLLAVPKPLRSPVGFDASVRWRETKNEVHVTRLDLEHTAGRLAIDGRVVADDALIEANVSGEIRGGAWLEPIVGPEIRFGTAQIEGRVIGPAAAPRVQAKATLSDVTAPGLSAGIARFVAEVDGPGAPARHVKADLEFTDLTYRSPIAAALLGKRAVVSAKANVDRDFSRWADITARLRSGAVELSATDGSLDGAARSGSLILEAAVADLVRAGRASGLSLSGAARSRAQISFEKDSISTTLSVAGERLAFGDRILGTLIGSRPRLRAIVNRSSAGTIIVRDLHVDAAALTGGGKADLDLRRDRIAAELDIRTGDLATLTALAGIEIGGRATMTATAKGRLLDPDVTAKLRLPAPTFESRTLAPLAIDLEAKSVNSNPTGTLLARYEVPEARIDASLGFALARSGKVRLHDIELRGLGSEVTGLLDVPLDGAPIEGKLTGAIPNLAIISPFFARRLEGAVSAEAVLGSAAGGQAVTFRIAGTGLAAGSDIAAAEVTCRANMQGLTSDGPFEASCRTKDMRVYDWRGTRASVSTVGTWSNAEVRIGAAGKQPLVHHFDAVAQVERSDKILKIALQKLTGEAGGKPVELSAPTRMDIAPGSMSVTPVKLRVGRGEVDISAKMADGKVSGDLRLKGVELSDYAAVHARPGLSGQIEATMSLRGALANPQAAFAVRVSRLSLAADTGTKSPLMEGRIDGGIVDGTVSVEAMLTGFAETGLRAMGKAPVRFSLAPFEFRPVDGGPIKAEMRWSGKLDPLVELLPVPGHSISGNASVSLDVSGTFKRPIATGSLRLREGRYENLFTGMVLTGVEFEAQGDADRIRLRITGGGDDESGRFDGSGAVTLDREKGFPLDLKVSFTELAAVRRDDVSAIANGRLSLTGGLDDLALRGDIETQRVEWQIGQPLPPSVIDVDVTEIGGSKSTEPQLRQNFGRNPGLRLDLNVRMPGNVFVRGRGLDSEWRGAVKVSGTTAKPSVFGKLERVRGQFEFAGNAFKLVHGVVTFPRGKEIDPLIDLRAEHAAKSLKATVAVTGKLSRPVIALTSVPQMPRDEILSRVIFGKGVGQLSRLEAAQLAVAVASVTGLDGGGGLIDTLRRSVGVDVLRVGADQAGSPTAVVGKNISDELYVGVEQGAESNSGKVQVELEVLPGIKLKSGVTAETQGNIGVEFRWDY